MASILIAEDEADLRMSIKTILEYAGYEVIEAAAGDQAFALMQARRPDLVLLDIMMPGMDGTQVLEAMRNDPVLTEVPVIVLTNFDMPFYREIATAGAVVDYIMKSDIPIDQIPEKVKAALAAKATTT